MKPFDENHPAIPKGWVRIRRGRLIRDGDRIYYGPGHPGCSKAGWRLTQIAGEYVGQAVFIRRIKK